MKSLHKRTLLFYILPSALILLFSILLLSGSWLKNPLGNDDRIFESIKKLECYAKQEKWNEAKLQVDYADKAWEKIVNRIQFSIEREDVYAILELLSRVRGAIVAKDKEAIIQEVYYFYKKWENVGR